MRSPVKTTTRPSAEMDDNRVLARTLVEREVLTLQQAKAALAQLQKEPGKTLEKILLDGDLIKEEDLLETKAALWHVPYIDLKNYEIDPEVLELVPAATAKKFKFFPLFRIDGTLLVAMTDPKDMNAIDKVAQLTQLEISPALSSAEALQYAIDRYYGKEEEVQIENVMEKISNEEIQDILEVIEAEEEKDIAGGGVQQTTADLERLAEEAPVVKMANMVLMQGIMDGASDVHINPEETMVRVRYRIDGVLRDSLNLPKNLQQALISRIKILSSMDIAENRIPQDGQMRIKTKSKVVDIRVSTLPSAHGENVVMRILDKNAALLKLENLGFEDDTLKMTRKLMSNAYGIILVTGPTGSGKTTTLYAVLNELNSVEKNIITLEDPIEYRLPLIRQSQVNHKAGMTFAKGLRSILRQDPDIVMVGEIRDSETGNIAIQAALTGHLVLSTLHTNDSAGAVTRLAEMGIEPFLISTAVLGVQAQRLVRRICPDCKEEYKPNFPVPETVLDYFGFTENDLKEIKFYHGKGCKKCNGKGYRGRQSILEVLPVTETIRDMILKGGSTDDIRNQAVKEGMRTMLMDGWIKIFKGVTTLDEVMRVTNIG
ncbi:Flp pilus assembly complex ATPase component TadA [bacterium]|nr:Flp pilus assembly complex ATPase component TadA [bacterium]